MNDVNLSENEKLNVNKNTTTTYSKITEYVTVPFYAASLLIDGFSRLLSVALLFIVVLSLWTTYKTFYQPSTEKKGFHVCEQCRSTFKCHQNKNNINQSKKINTFRRRSVNIGNLPIDIAETAPVDTCCKTAVGDKEYSFCKFDCYLTYARKNNSSTINVKSTN
jgi:hypothetical protein